MIARRLVRAPRKPGNVALGLALVAIGGTVALAAQLAAPVGLPLYDGAVVNEPYRFLHPGSGEVGDPSSFTSTPSVADGSSPVLVAATTENPPQAQLLAQQGAFTLPTGTTSLQISVGPVEAPAPPPEGQVLAGNVYRFAATSQDGAPLSVAVSCAGCLSIVLRAPENTEHAQLVRLDGSTWTELPTTHAGGLDLYKTNPTALGDFAIMSEAPAPAEPDLTTFLVIGALAVSIAGALALLWLQRRGRGSNGGAVAAPVRDRPPRAPARPAGGPPKGRAGRNRRR